MEPSNQPQKRRKNWSSPEVSRYSCMVLSYQYSNTHICDLHEYRQKQYINSIKLCGYCHRYLPFDSFKKTDHAVSGSYTSQYCHECVALREIQSQLDLNILKRQARGTHISDLFDHYSVGVDNALREFDKMVCVSKNRTVRDKKRTDLAAIRESKRVLRCGALGLPDVTNVFNRVVHQFKKYRKQGKTEIVINRNCFKQLLGYTPEQLHAHLVETATSEMHVMPTQDVHIDHEFPVSAFDLTNLADLRKSYSLSNLRFMSGFENSKKSHRDARTVRLFT